MTHLKYEENAGIGWLKISRPDVLNALNQPLLQELIELITRLDSDESLRVLMITGDGDKSFVAGADIAAMKDMTTKQALEFATLGQRAFSLIDDFTRPVIAAVNGFALGGGMELALACDFIVASDKAKFGQPEVKLGLIPGFGGTQRLSRRIGVSMAKDLIFSGRIIDAGTAIDIGLVNRVVPAGELASEAEKIAKEIALQSPCAVAASKRSINAGFDIALNDALKIEREAFSKSFETEDQKEGCAAFVEKRKPTFKGK